MIGNSNKINKVTLRSQIKEYIYNQIKTGTYKPGDRIGETKLAKELNVSQSPVREAMLELSAMGLLEERPYSGTFVRKLSSEDIEDIYNIRAMIEEYAAKKATELMTKEDLRDFLPVLQGLKTAAMNNDVKTYGDYDIKFHEIIVEGAKSKALKRTWYTLHMGEWTSYTLLATNRPLSDLFEEHKMIYKHIVNRSAESAGAAVFLHIKKFSEDLVRYIDLKE